MLALSLNKLALGAFSRVWYQLPAIKRAISLLLKSGRRASGPATAWQQSKRMAAGG